MDLSYVADLILLVIDRDKAIKEATRAKEAVKIVRISGNHRTNVKDILI